jgi:hypothetical protein
LMDHPYAPIAPVLRGQVWARSISISLSSNDGSVMFMAACGELGDGIIRAFYRCGMAKSTLQLSP